MQQISARSGKSEILARQATLLAAFGVQRTLQAMVSTAADPKTNMLKYRLIKIDIPSQIPAIKRKHD